MADPQTERRLSRLENDSTALYELVAGISSTQREHSRRFDAMDVRFDALDRRFHSVEATLAEVVRRLPEPS